MKTIGIIGGKGIMGNFFAKLFKKKGFRVLISDLGTRLSNKKLVQLADVVMISVPIHQTQKVISEILPFTRKNQLLTDVTSLKVFPMREMRKGKAAVIGLHPMFRPGPSGLHKQNIVICPVRASKKEIVWLSKIFKSEGAIINKMTPQKHDRLMATIQVLIHFHSMVLGRTLRSLKPNMRKIMKVMSPVYRLQFDVVCRIFSQDPFLYASIGIENPETKTIVNHFTRETKKLGQLLLKKNYKTFLADFRETAQFLGPYSAEALAESDALLGLFAKI